MKITGEILQKIENKLWEQLKNLNKNEKQLIEDRNISYYSVSEFADAHGYISCINYLQELKEIINDNEGYINHYGLEEFKTKNKVEVRETKEAIKTLKAEYQNKLNELLAESIPNNGGLYAIELFSTAHYLESGIDTLNALEERLDD